MTNKYSKVKDALKLLIGIALILIFAAIMLGATEPQAELKNETYIVQQGDTLNSIALKYEKISAYPINPAEFAEGLFEINYDLLKDRPDGVINSGDKLKVNVWIKKISPHCNAD